MAARKILILDEEKTRKLLIGENPKVLEAYVNACSCTKCGKC